MDAVVVDFSNLFHRSAHAYESLSWIVDGKPTLTGSMYGCVRKVSELIKQYNQSPICIMIEPEHNRERKTINPEYKANRGERPKDFYLLYEDTLRVLSMFPQVAIFSSEQDGEADDVIATFVKQYKDQFNKFFVYSGDNDLLQIASDIVLVDRMFYLKDKGEAEFWRYCREKHGVTPDKILLYRSIVGDASDGLKPPIERFQKKHVREIIEGCEDWEDVVAVDAAGFTGSKRLKFDKLVEHREELRKNYEVMLLKDLVLEKMEYQDVQPLGYYIGKYGMESFKFYLGGK